MTTDLIARCASHGWTLRPDGDGWELLGNGAPAAFGSTASLVAWLEKQKPPVARVAAVAPIQMTMFDMEYEKAA